MTSTTSRSGVGPAEARLVSFDGEQGVTVREPDKAEPSYWVGCPGAFYDETTELFYLTYRRRHPRGIEPERGYVNTIARSVDGVHFEDIWAVTKEQLGTSSMERSCLRRNGEQWILYLSYVDPVDSRWRIDAVTADAPENLDVTNRQTVLTAKDTGTEAVKDPYVMRVGPVWMMFASCAVTGSLSPAQQERAHANGDIYTTGLGTHPTGFATSLDGLSFAWQGETFGVGANWDAYQARLNSVLPLAGGGFLGFYDGSASEKENYEERCGLVHSFDLRHWTRLTPDGPRFTSPHATGSLRYVDVLTAAKNVYVYYEDARRDGAHELRVQVINEG